MEDSSLLASYIVLEGTMKAASGKKINSLT